MRSEQLNIGGKAVARMIVAGAWEVGPGRECSGFTTGSTSSLSHPRAGRARLAAVAASPPARHLLFLTSRSDPSSSRRPGASPPARHLLFLTTQQLQYIGGIGASPPARHLLFLTNKHIECQKTEARSFTTGSTSSLSHPSATNAAGRSQQRFTTGSTSSLSHLLLPNPLPLPALPHPPASGATAGPHRGVASVYGPTEGQGGRGVVGRERWGCGTEKVVQVSNRC